MPRAAPTNRPKQLRLIAPRIVAPVVREPILHKAIAKVLSVEIAPPGKPSREGVFWFSVDMAAYSGRVPGLRTGRGCIAGVPDIHVYWRGRVFLIELKAMDGRLSDAQQLFFATSTYGEVPVGVARSVEETLELLDVWKIPRSHRVKI